MGRYHAESPGEQMARELGRREKKNVLGGKLKNHMDLEVTQSLEFMLLREGRPVKQYVRKGKAEEDGSHYKRTSESPIFKWPKLRSAGICGLSGES